MKAIPQNLGMRATGGPCAGQTRDQFSAACPMGRSLVTRLLRRLYALATASASEPTWSRGRRTAGIALGATCGLERLEARMLMSFTLAEAPSALAAAANSSTSIALTWTDNADSETGFEIDYSTSDTFASGVTQVAVAGENVTGWTVTGLTPGTPYFFRVRATDADTDSADSSTATATTTTQFGAFTATQDVGAVGRAGSASFSGGTYTVSGSGIDVWSLKDEFRFLYRDMTGDGQITARITSVQNTNAWAKAGVMIRDGLADNTTHGFMLVSPTSGSAFQRRLTAGGSSTGTSGGSTITAPVWVRLVRAGSTLTGYQSADGTTWTQVGQVTISMSATVKVGLAVTSHADGTLCAATFDNVAVVPASPAAPTALTATPASGSRINLAWADNASNETSYLVDRATDAAFSQGLTTIALPAGATAYADTGRAPGVTYHYRVRATNAGSDSANSSPASAVIPLNAPTGLTATAVSLTRVDLAWQDNSNAETGFAIDRSETPTFTQVTTFTAPADATAYFDTTARPGRTYYYRVRGVTAIGDTPNSATASVTLAQTLNMIADDADSTTTTLTGTWTNQTGGSGFYGGGYKTDSNTGKGTKSVLFAPPLSAGSYEVFIRWPVDPWTATNVPLDIIRAGGTDLRVVNQSTNGGLWNSLGTFTFSGDAGEGVRLRTDGTNKKVYADAVRFVNVGVAPVAPGDFRAAAVTSTTADVTWTDAENEQGYRVERRTAGGAWAEIATTGTDVTRYIDTALTTGTTYEYRVRAYNAGGTSGYTPGVSVTPVTRTNPFTGNQDIGTFSPAGSYSFSDGQFTVSGAGSDIYNLSDQFQFVYQVMTGDGTITARVSDIQRTATNAKAGVMIRNSLAADAANMFMYLTPSDGPFLQYRTRDGRHTDLVGAGEGAAPGWVRVVRRGGEVTGFLSEDGQTWTAIGTASLTLGTNVYVGLALTSHRSGTLNTSKFDNVEVRGFDPANAAPTIATPAAAAPSLVTGKTASLSVLAADDGGDQNLTYTWSAPTMPAGITQKQFPAFSSAGRNSSKNVTVTFGKAGTYVLRATATDGERIVTSDVTVTVQAVHTSLSLTPAMPTVYTGSATTLTSSSKDQFNLDLSPQPAKTWSVISGGGTVTSAGVYTAPTTGGTATIRVTDGTYTRETQITIVSPAPVVPGDLTPTASSYIGNNANASVRGSAVAADGTIILAANIGTTNPGGVTATLLNGATATSGGAIIRLTADGRTVLSVTRVADAVNDLSTDAAGNIYVAARTVGLLKLDATGATLLWARAGHEADRVDAAPNGDVVALDGAFDADQVTPNGSGTVYVYNAAGVLQGSFGGHRRTYDVAIDSGSGSVFLTGFNQLIGPSTNPVQVAYVRSLTYAGAIKWNAYDWSAAQVDDPGQGGTGPTNNMADTRGCRIDMGDDGKLYVGFMAAGGNHIFRYDPFNLFKSVGIVGGDSYHDFSNSESQHKVFFARYDAATGAYLTGQQFHTRLDDGTGNTASMDQGGEIQADKFGRVYITGKSSYGLPQTFNPLPASAYTGGPFLLVMSPDFRDRLFVSRYYASNGALTGDGHTVAARVLDGNDHPNVVFGGVAGAGMWTQSPIQAAPAGSLDGFFGVLGLGSLLSTGAPVTASTTQSGYTPASLVDGDTGTAWRSTSADAQWVQIDLVSAKVITEVTLRFGANYARSFNVQVSDDGVTWRTLRSVTNATGGVVTLNIGAVAQYIRVNLTTRLNTTSGFELTEIEVRGAI